MPWQAPPIGGQQHARPPREGLPPFPTQRGDTSGGVFQRIPPDLRGRPLPEPPDIPSPGVVLRTGERVNRGTLFDPVNVAAYGSVAALLAVLARKASGQEPEPRQEPQTLPPTPTVAVDPALRRRQFEADRRKLEEGSRMDLGTEIPFVLSQLDELFFGKEKDFALAKLLGGLGQGGKVQVNALKEFLVGTPLGGGEEEAIARMNDQLREQRRIMAERIFLALGLIPRGGEGGPAGFVGPQESADP